MTEKARLSATVDADLLAAAQQATAAGRAPSVSSWINDALRLKADHDRRMVALDAFLEAFEEKHGAITDADMDAAARRGRARAVVVRGRSQPTARRRRT